MFVLFYLMTSHNTTTYNYIHLQQQRMIINEMQLKNKHGFHKIICSYMKMKQYCEEP